MDKEPRTKQFADQDSDAIYVTNQPDIVKHAKYCYINYPTIVNTIPLDPHVYNYDMVDFALIDNSLAHAQLAIGESSNLAQICLTYTYNYDDKKYQEFVCILSVLAQIAIDNAKRKYDITFEQEIAYIKSHMNISENGLPKFWLITKKDKRKARTEKERRDRSKRNRKKIIAKVNNTLDCPMNYLYSQELDTFRDNEATIDMSEFWIKHEQEEHHRKSDKIEKMIQKYSLDLYNYNISDDSDNDEYFLLKTNFDELILNIRQVYISKNYLGMMSWLINRAFGIGAGVKSKKSIMNSSLSKNRSLLLKVLYTVNPKAFLQCFKKVAND